MRTLRIPRGLTELFVILCVAVCTFIPAALASDEHGEGGNLEHVVATDSLSGFSLFLADLYNEHRLLYALVVTATMALLGVMVALIADYVLRLVGFRKVRKST